MSSAESLHLSSFVHMHPHTHTHTHLPPRFPCAVVNTPEWRWGDFLQTKPCFFIQAGPVAGMAVTTTPQGSCDSWTLDSNKGLVCSQPKHPREEQAHGPLVGRGVDSPAEPCPGPCAASVPHAAAVLEGQSPRVLPWPAPDRCPCRSQPSSPPAPPALGCTLGLSCSAGLPLPPPHSLFPSSQIGQRSLHIPFQASCADFKLRFTTPLFSHQVVSFKGQGLCFRHLWIPGAQHLIAPQPISVERMNECTSRSHSC